MTCTRGSCVQSPTGRYPDIHDMWQEGDGEQDVRFFKRKVEVVLQELIADERLEGCQH